MQVREKKPWWMCALEEDYWRNPEWNLVHNGQQNPVQFVFPAEEIKKFTRKYRKGNAYRVFYYDLNKPVAEFRWGQEKACVRIQLGNSGAEHNKKEETFERV